MLENAEAQGIAARGLKNLKKVGNEFSDVFRIRRGSDPPAKVAPMIVKLSSNAVPIKSSSIQYKPEQ